MAGNERRGARSKRQGRWRGERETWRRGRTGQKQEPETKYQTRKAQDTRTREKLARQVQRGLSFRKVRKGNDWERGEKIESDNQK